MLIMASESQARMKIRNNFPLASMSTLQKLYKIYPSPSTSNGEYADQFGRVNALISGYHRLNSITYHRVDIQLQHALYSQCIQ